MKGVILRNSFFSTVAYSISSILWIVLIPLIIQRLGEETYGIWAIASIIISASNLINLGLPVALTKYTAEFVAKNQEHRIIELLRATDILYIIISVTSLFVIILLNNFIIHHVFGVREAVRAETLRNLLPLMVPLSLLFLLSTSRKSIADGYQEIRFSSQVTLFGRFANFSMTILFILKGLGVWSLYLAAVIENGLTMMFYIHFVRRKIKSDSWMHSLDLTHNDGSNLQKWRGGWKDFNFISESLRESIKYGMNLQLSALITFGLEIFYKSFISNILGLAYLGLFQVAWRLIQVMQGFLTSALRPLFPASASLIGADNKIELHLLFRKATQYSILISSSILVLIIPFSDLMFRLWIGINSPFQTITFQLLCLWVAFSTLATPGFLYLMGAGRSVLITIIQGASSACALVLALAPYFLTKEYPVILIGLSYALGGLVAYLITLWYTQKVFHWKISSIYKQAVPTVAVIGAAILTLLAFYFTSLLDSIPYLSLTFVIILPTYLLLMMLFGIPRDDRATVMNFVMVKLRNGF